MLVGVLAFLETGAFVGLVAPGETAVILGGAVAGQGETSIVLTIAIVWFCGLARRHDELLVGRRLGRELVLRHGPRLRITARALRAGRGVLRQPRRQDDPDRPLHRPGAGAGAVHRRQLGDALPRVPPYSILGTGLWATAFSLLGYFASQNIDAVRDRGQGALAFGIVAGSWSPRWWFAVSARAGEPRAAGRGIESAGTPGPAHARVAGSAAGRFLLSRLTPGGLGLELTTPLAALAVAHFVLIAYALSSSATPGPTPGDSQAIDFVDKLRDGVAHDVAKVVTALGSSVPFSSR